MSKFARSSKTCEKLEKSQFLLKLIKTSVRRGRRVPSKNYDFCNFCDFSKTCEKLEKSQFLLKLRQVLEGEGCPAKTAISVVSAISPKICEKWEKSQCLLKLLNSSGKGGIRRVPSKHYDFCNICDFSKNCEQLENSQFLLNYYIQVVKDVERCPTKIVILFLRFLQKLGNLWVGDALSMICMYEVNLMVFLYRFILHGIRPIAEIVGILSTDLYVLRRK